MLCTHAPCVTWVLLWLYETGSCVSTGRHSAHGPRVRPLTARARQAQVTPGHETGEDSTASLGSSPRSANGENVIKHPHMHKAKKGIKKLGAKIKKAFNPDSDSATTTA
jgi:hypothetical protein